jgi:transposase-like protein
MRRSNYSDEQILAILQEVDRDRVAAVAQRHNISKQTIYVWRKRFGIPRSRSQFETLRDQLGEPLASHLETFCAIHYGAPEINVIREAVRTFIDERLAREPELRKRFDKEQQGRTEPLAGMGRNLKDTVVG